MRLGHLDGGRLPTVWNVAWSSKPQCSLRGATYAQHLPSTVFLQSDYVGHRVWNPTSSWLLALPSPMKEAVPAKLGLCPRYHAALTRRQGQTTLRAIGIIPLPPISHVED